ncbi:MAG TPA: hypothetical protein VEZ48_02405 [Sphingomonadaceae bacterium]|nr:hypothetical protein [Sphingomonadaceae bacterium]
MLRGWTRRGRAEMVKELGLLARHAEVLASQARATDTHCGAEQAFGFLSRARRVLAESGTNPDVSARELRLLHSLAVRQVADAERDLHARQVRGPEHVI